MTKVHLMCALSVVAYYVRVVSVTATLPIVMIVYAISVLRHNNHFFCTIKIICTTIDCELFLGGGVGWSWHMNKKKLSLLTWSKYIILIQLLLLLITHSSFPHITILQARGGDVRFFWACGKHTAPPPYITQKPISFYPI